MVERPQVHYQDLIYPILLFLSAQIVLDVIWRLSNIVEWRSEPYVRRSILVNSYDYVQSHSYSFFQSTLAGTISSKIKGILDGYDKFWGSIHHGFFYNIFKIVVNLAALAIVNINLSLFIFVWGIFYISFIGRLSLTLDKLSFEETELRHQLIGQISDKITNIFSLFSFSAQKRERENLYHCMTTGFLPKHIEVYKYNFKIQLAAGFFYLLKFSFFLFYLVHLKMNGVISVGDFAFVFGLSLVLSGDIWHVTVEMQSFFRAMGDLKSALSILSLSHENMDAPNAQVLHVQQPKVTFDAIDFRYTADKPLFEKFSLTIQPGEKLGIVGASGTGKSSLVNLLSRYFTLNSGHIFIDQQDISTVTQDSLRENIAVIPQDAFLFHRSIWENIAFGKAGATDEDIIAASKRAHIHDFIMTLPEKYDTEVGERGVKLSGGQRQRIAIARAFLKNAPIFILDEATSALDSHTEQLIQDSLYSLMQDRQKTVIAIAHRLPTLKHMDRIIVLNNGQIVEEGTHNQLIKKADSLYQQLWQLQQI